ncbi:MAG TPA: RNA 2',3'-cyclic phosphodiesterase [Candidatus Binatia bacterium]
MARLFVAVKIDPDVLERIGRAQARLENNLSGLRWVKRENLHLTLKFLGQVSDERITPVGEALERTLAPLSRGSVSTRGLGVFPDIRRPKVLWAGLDAAPLAPLARAVEEALAPLGFAREAREFKPHLTIGRWREFAGRPDALRSEIEKWRAHDFGASEIREVVLFQSVLKPDGAIYTPLKIFPLR